MPESSSNPSTSLITVQQLQLESERMQEVVLLVDNLLRQEEITLGLIVDCMYDIGSVRLIDKKLNLPFLRGATVRVARVSKPLFRLLALRWIKKNCPELLAKWLYSKVLFDEEPKPVSEPNAETAANTQSTLENPNPVEEIAEQVSHPPHLPDAVETAIDTGRVPPMTAPPESPALNGSATEPVISSDRQVLELENRTAPAPSLNHQAWETEGMSATPSLKNSPTLEADDTGNPSPVADYSVEEPPPNTPPPAEGSAMVETSIPTMAPPNSQVLMSVEPSHPLPLPAITLEEYNRAIAQIKFRDTEISKLRNRSYVLAGLLVTVSVALGGALFWPLHSPGLGSPNAEPVQSRGTSLP